MMPNGWQVSKLKDISEFRRGSFPQPYGLPEWYDDENGFPFVQVYDVDGNGRLKPTTKRKISKAAAEKSVFVPAGTILITIQGSIGRVAITQYDAYVDRTLLIISKLNEEIDKTYFSFILRELFELEAQRAPGGTIKTITKEALSEFTVQIPPKNEQEKIAKILSTWDEAIEKYEVFLNKKEQRYQISLNDILGKSISGATWKDSILENVSLKITDGAHSSPPSSNGGYPMLSVKDMREFGFDLTQPRMISEKHYHELIKLGCKPEVGDVLIAKDGSVLKYIFEVKRPIEAVLLSSIAIIRANPKIIIPSFLAHFFRRNNFKDYVRRELTSGSGVPRIVLKDFRKIKIHTPDLSTQKRIVALLDTSILEIDLTRQVIDLLKIQKQGLMQQLLTGKKRVRL